MLPDFLKARAVIKKKQHAFLVEAMRRHTPPYMQQASYKIIYEGNHMSVEYGDGCTYEKPIAVLSAESNPGSVTDLISTPNKVYQHLNEMAQQFVEKQSAAMIQTITEVTEMTGNVVQGNAFTVESIFAILEKFHMNFDDAEQPQFPTIMVGPDRLEQMKKLFLEIQTDPALKARHDELIETKRKQWHDRQNFRKLVG